MTVFGDVECGRWIALGALDDLDGLAEDKGACLVVWEEALSGECLIDVLPVGEELRDEVCPCEVMASGVFGAVEESADNVLEVRRLEGVGWGDVESDADDEGLDVHRLDVGDGFGEDAADFSVVIVEVVHPFDSDGVVDVVLDCLRNGDGGGTGDEGEIRRVAVWEEAEAHVEACL